MKRPRWLGGRKSPAEGDGGETAGRSVVRRDKRPAEESDPKATAAERSARRTATSKRPDTSETSSRSARRTLGERVGTAAGNAPEKPRVKAETEANAKDEAEATAKAKADKPRGKGPGDEKPGDEKPRERLGRKQDPQAEGTSGAGGRKELHRPRRQREDERRRGKETESGERTRGREKTSDSGRAAGKPEGEKSRRAERKPIRPRVRATAARFAGALRSGGVGARKYAAATAPKVGLGVLTVLGWFFTVFFIAFGFILNALIAIWLFIAPPVGWVLSRLSRLTNAASRLLTPIRVLALVVAGAAVLLALSQYADYRTISISNDAYSGVQTVAPAPETGRLEAGDAHSYVFVPIAIACLLLLGGALTGRWRLCRLIALAGAAAIVVALVVDRPAGLDTGDAALTFDGVSASLLGGFYAQIAAGILLIGSSSLLARELRLAGASARLGLERGREGEPKRGEGARALRRPDARGARA